MKISFSFLFTENEREAKLNFSFHNSLRLFCLFYVRENVVWNLELEKAILLPQPSFYPQKVDVRKKSGEGNAGFTGAGRITEALAWNPLATIRLQDLPPFRNFLLRRWVPRGTSPMDGILTTSRKTFRQQEIRREPQRTLLGQWKFRGRSGDYFWLNGKPPDTPTSSIHDYFGSLKKFTNFKYDKKTPSDVPVPTNDFKTFRRVPGGSSGLQIGANINVFYESQPPPTPIKPNTPPPLEKKTYHGNTKSATTRSASTKTSSTRKKLCQNLPTNRNTKSWLTISTHPT